ncbi:MAG TPA: hypothetical protein VK395_17635 [Gemmataceae bacterium]|nr:hypothetical protein [Gemmataceae bacterium]
MEQSANCYLALGRDMLSRPRQVGIDGFGPGLGRENMAPKFN